jgi:hypothetical protein
LRQLLRSRLALALVLVLAPVLGQFLAVFFLGVNTPVADEFYYADFMREVREGGEWLPMLWRQHNEHRVVPVKLTMVLLEPFFGWNLKAEMYVSAILAGLTVLGLWRLYRRAGGTDLLLFAPAAWLFCNLAQYENMLYGLLMCHYYAAAGVVWTLVFLARRSVAGFALACLCGIVASLSLLNGLLVWPVGLFLLLARGERRGWTVAWTLAGIATFAAFFQDWQQPPGLEAMEVGLKDAPQIGGYALSMLGAPLAAGSVTWSQALGLALLTLTAALVLSWLRREGRERLRDDALLFSLTLFGLLTCAVIAGGRALTTISPLQSRYVAYTALAYAGAYLLASRAAERSGTPLIRNPRLVAALALLVPAMIAADIQGFRYAQLWRVVRLREQFYLQTFELQQDAAFGPPHFVSQLRGRFAPYLRAERLNAFSEPQRVLLLTRPDEREAAGPVVPGRPVELRLSCPVDVLREFTVNMSREAPPDASTVSVSLWEGTDRLAVLDLPVSALASGWAGPVPVRLPRPLRKCQGRELTFRIESDAPAATQVTVWTYPHYYDAVLRQGDGPLAPGRSLGLLLNAHYVGL